MHLRHVKIRHFKGVSDFSESFLRADDSPRPLTMLLGGNGSGKTTILQAIALVISLATRKRSIESSSSSSSSSSSEFKWPGFLIERISSGGPTRIELVLGFDETERAATVDLHRRWKRSALPPAVLDSVANAVADTSEITVIYENGELSCKQGPEGLALCLGRYFIRTILRTHPDLRSRFRDVGDVFWFDQSRNLLSAEIETPGIEGLRQYLIIWYATHHSYTQRPNQVDYLAEIERHFSQLFEGARFVGVGPRPGLSSASPQDSYFLIEREGTTYDLAEMSSGEQAVFPLLFDFVRLEVARSIVLIDEVELHLHPPQQQALLTSLRRIGPECQYVMTTHSPYLESIMPDDEEIRLAGGTL